MINKYMIDIGRNVDTRYILELNKENAVLIAGYTNSGKTNLIDHIKNQLMVSDCEVFNYSKRIRSFDKFLIESHGSKVNAELKDYKKFNELKKHKKEIEKRKKLVTKSKVEYSVYAVENTDWKDRFLFIDDFSINLMDFKMTDKEKYNEYVELLHYIIEEGSKYGYLLILCGYRCKNSDIPNSLSNISSCKMSFTNPYGDLEDWDLIEEGMKYPKKVGELLIVSNTYLNEKVFVKSYSI